MRAAGIEPEPVGSMTPTALVDQAVTGTVVWVGSPDGDPGWPTGSRSS